MLAIDVPSSSQAFKALLHWCNKALKSFETGKLVLMFMQRGSGGRRQGAFFDIRVFHPNAPSYLRTQPASLFRKHEMEKKWEYGDRVRSVEHGSFTPLVLSTFGGLGREATVFYSRLADLLSKKHSTPYTKTLSLLCCSISFSLLRSAILAIRGNRCVVHLECPSTSVELRLAEAEPSSYFYVFSFSITVLSSTYAIL